LVGSWFPEWPIKRDRAHSLRVDGALVDEFRLTHGFWEAKDSQDDLGKEVKKKLTAGYPQTNIIFQAPERAILWQNGRSVLDVDITEPVALVELIKQFFDYTPPGYEDWNDAVTHFQNQVPELGRALAELIKHEEKSNPRFRAAFDDFLALCRSIHQSQPLRTGCRRDAHPTSADGTHLPALSLTIPTSRAAT